MPTPPANGRAPGRASHPVVGPLPWVAGRLHANQCTTDTPLPSDCSNQLGVSPCLGPTFLVRFRTQTVASVTDPGVRRRVDN